MKLPFVCMLDDVLLVSERRTARLQVLEVPPPAPMPTSKDPSSPSSSPSSSSRSSSGSVHRGRSLSPQRPRRALNNISLSPHVTMRGLSDNEEEKESMQQKRHRRQRCSFYATQSHNHSHPSPPFSLSSPSHLSPPSLPHHPLPQDLSAGAALPECTAPAHSHGRCAGG